MVRRTLRAMNVPCGLLAVWMLVCRTESRCSPTSYYKNCWIRRFPGIFIDIEESLRRGAQLLRVYQEDTALKCSRTCCLTRNFSCNLAIFHYDTVQENVNCYHLHCPTLESCILSHRGNVVLYNVTKGVDPDLLVFGKYFTSNVRVLPHHYTRVNASEPLASDKRHFNHPPLPPAQRLTSAPSAKASTPTGAVSPSIDIEPAPLTSTTNLSSTIVPSTTHVPTTTTNARPTLPYASVTPGTPAGTSHPSPAETSYSSTTKVTANTRSHRTSPFPQRGTATVSAEAASPSTSMAMLSNMESSNHYTNETKGHLGRNHTADSEGNQGLDGDDSVGGLGAGWHVAAHTLLVVVATCVSVLLSCCCSILVVVSWRGRRKRKGRYRTTWRAKGGSMRLIKYVLVREGS